MTCDILPVVVVFFRNYSTIVTNVSFFLSFGDQPNYILIFELYVAVILGQINIAAAKYGKCWIESERQIYVSAALAAAAADWAPSTFVEHNVYKSVYHIYQPRAYT